MKHRSAFLLIAFGFIVGSTTTLGATQRGSDIFPDVGYGSYYDVSVGEMNALGIIQGYENGNFGPNDPVTRGQVAVLMKRLRDELLGVSSSSSSRSRRSSSSSTSSSSSYSSVATNSHGTFRFTTESFTIHENDGTATISVIRAGGNDGAVTVQYTSAADTATLASDFDLAEGILTFADGETSRTFTVAINDDDEGEGDETVTLTLSNPSGGAVLGTPVEATLTIHDDETPSSSSSTATTSAGVFQFSATEYKASEAGGTITIAVERVDGNTGSASVDFRTSDGTADSQHYTSISGTLSFSSDETEKTFSVSIKNNELIGGNKTVMLSLNSPTNTATLGENKLATLTIHDDEIAVFGTGSLQFTDDQYEGSEFDGKAVVTVERMGGAKGEISVDYATQDSTAKKLTDYTETSGTLTFREGEIAKTITIPITNDTANDPNEVFTVKLTNPSGGSTLSSPSVASVIIQ